MPEMFVDRIDAGRQLALRLAHLGSEQPVVLGLPRGGVPVAAEVATAIGAPLDVVVVRKLGVPFQPEVAMGAIGEDGTRFVDQALVDALGIATDDIERVEADERATLDTRQELFCAGRERVDLTGRVAVIIDDGIATGATASVACTIVRGRGAARIVVAAPVGGQDAARRVHGADEVICLVQPTGFQAVGAHYRHFEQTSDDEVVALLHRHR